MSGLARVLLDLGFDVRGSDINSTPVTERLKALGATIYRGHAGVNVGDAELVVYSTAIGADNPEMQAAREKGVQVIHRADLLGLLMKRQKGLAVAGAHGKTTTSAMLALVLEKCQQDPTILIGGELTDIGGNAKFGRGAFLVAEADESDRSFLKLQPYLAVVTNIEDDHLDHYGSLEEIINAFRQFISKIPANGTAVLCIDDEHVRAVAADCAGQVITYALDNPNADYTVCDIRVDAGGSTGEVYSKGRYLGKLVLAVPGRHNLANALAVVAVCRNIGLSFGEVARCLQGFKGAGRRYQLIGREKGITVVDDYAHHPTEIAATLRAARQVHSGRVIAVFQPHRYTRTQLLFRRFGACFADADMVIVNDIYSAGEKPIAGVSAGLIADAVQASKGERPQQLPSGSKTVDYLTGILREGDLVLTMGAGDVWKTGVELVNRLKESK
ncbi:UDP-N-acetylmuramate--L-alanine ligase [Desulfallas thermosapovorans DSM 6562]|uniref:UDP-N-acetylmuramate--L-alanine ligase n=2 Tax=Desulfallas thermosapovorans TaxID=58137 RepID=A0A5S4ZTA1_9FIRM|nr:UDP-N-acetylmuramate--L-alanine ligase [Desulfallas thermosapovorans DSM 6562]